MPETPAVDLDAIRERLEDCKMYGCTSFHLGTFSNNEVKALLGMVDTLTAALGRLVALAEEWEAREKRTADYPDSVSYGKGEAFGLCAAELRAALGGADPRLPGKPLPSGMDYRPMNEVPGAELSPEGKAEVARKAASVQAARVRAGEGGDKTFGGMDSKPTEPEPPLLPEPSLFGGVLTDCTGKPITRPAPDPDTQEAEQ